MCVMRRDLSDLEMSLGWPDLAMSRLIRDSEVHTKYSFTSKHILNKKREATIIFH